MKVQASKDIVMYTHQTLANTVSKISKWNETNVLLLLYDVSGLSRRQDDWVASVYDAVNGSIKDLDE